MTRLLESAASAPAAGVRWSAMAAD